MRIDLNINIRFKDTLDILVGKLHRPRLNPVVGPAEEQLIEEGEKPMFTVPLKATQNRTVKVPTNGTDKKGNPAPLDGPPVFASDSPAIVTFETDPRDPSGFTGIASAVGPVGTANLTITADGKVGDGVVEIIENGLSEVTAGDAVALAIEVGDPEEQE